MCLATIKQEYTVVTGVDPKKPNTYTGWLTSHLYLGYPDKHTSKLGVINIILPVQAMPSPE